MTNPSAQTMLEPCPFCGGSPDLTDYFGNYNKASWCVHCKNCDLSLDGDNLPEEAIKRWNTRAASAPAAVRLDVNCRDCGKPIDTAYILQHPRSCIVCDPEFGDPQDSHRPALATLEEASTAAGEAEIVRTIRLWFEQQIENAQQDQISGFAAKLAAGMLRGERAYARHCAMYEAKQMVLAALAAPPVAQTDGVKK